MTLTEMSMAACDDYVWFEYGAYAVGVGCPTGQPTFTWEGDTHHSYTEAGGTVSFAFSSNGIETLGPSNPRVTFVILNPTIGVKSFTLWAVSYSDMVFSQSPGN